MSFTEMLESNVNKMKFIIILIGIIVAGSFKSQLIDYFRGRIVSWEKVEGSLWQFYDN